MGEEVAGWVGRASVQWYHATSGVIPSCIVCTPTFHHHPLSAQVSIIRQVEVDIANETELQRASHKEERGKLKLWSGKAKEAAAAIAERDGEHGEREGGALGLGRMASHVVSWKLRERQR